MKIISLIILCSLAVSPLAYANTGVFQVSAVIPHIPGVNYFPAQTDIAPESVLKESGKDTSDLLVTRNGQQVVLQTHVVK